MKALLLLLWLAFLGFSHETNHKSAIKDMVAGSCPEKFLNADGVILPNSAVYKEGYCAFVFAYGLSNPRGIVNINDTLIVVERGRVTLSAIDLNSLGDEDVKPISRGDVSKWKSIYQGTQNLNHGIAYDKENEYLYASSPSDVYRWKYDTVTKTVGSMETVVSGMARSGGHVTRTLLFNDDNELLMSIGSGSNLDSDSERARVIKYDVQNMNLPQKWNDYGTYVKLYADGLRNEVGLTVDPRGRVWGVENGVDYLMRNDLGGDIHNENPGEELNLLEEGKNYGYPHCWSECNIKSYMTDWDSQKTRQFAQPEFMPEWTDTRCRDEVTPPKHVAQSHMAPLGIEFSDENTAFVAFHGSWNRNPSIGYRIDIYDFTEFNKWHDDREKREQVERKIDGGVGDENKITSKPFLAYNKDVAFDRSWIRPVSPVMGKCPYFGQCLFLTDDFAGTIIAVGYDPDLMGTPFTF
mmetsp:Transcript_33654/g.52613  ORF Transcript_33654/g.52613 Transcript_33654/m.52613 type:complete len:465 (-) Transcript_33654:110-1504(-)